MDIHSSDGLVFPASISSFALATVSYLKAYELFEEAITEEVKHFSVVEQSDETHALESSYAGEVLSLESGMFMASCRWLQSRAVITAEDIQTILALKEFRTILAQQEQTLFGDDQLTTTVGHVVQMQAILLKVERWVRRSLASAIHPVFAEQDCEAVQPGEDQSGVLLLISRFIGLLETTISKSP